MKKSLSLLLAISLVFGLFASMASAADAPALTTAEKYKWFVDAGILKGTPDGGAHEADKLTRAEFATIAIAAAGLTSATSGKTFSDVKKGQWYYGAIEAAAKAGLVNGIGSGKFGPKTNVTIESIIKVSVLIAGLKPVAGATVAGASNWAAPYVKAALDAGLITAQASYKGLATRGDVINIAFAVVQIKSVPTLKDVNAKANADDTITVTGTVYGKADSVKVALGTATAVAATLKADGTFSYTTAAQVAGDYKVTVVAYDGAKASVAVEKTVTIEKFLVSSVTVQNSKQIVVKFNKTVKDGILAGGHKFLTGGNLASYKLGTASVTYPTDAALSDDKMTVTLTFPGNFANNTYEQLLISGLKSASGLNLVEFKQAISLVDSTAPSVAKVAYSGVKATVEFSEPIKNSGTDINAAVSVNGIQVGLSSSPIDYDFVISATGYVTLTFNGLAGGKSYAVSLIAVEDLVGNRVDLSTTLAVPSDSVAPTVTTVKAEGSSVRIKFSEAVKTNVKLATAQGTVYSGQATDSNNEVVVALGGLFSSNFLNTSVTISDYYDLVDNKGASFTQAITLTKDTAAPTNSSVTVAGNQIILKFNEAVTPVAAAYTVGTVDFTSTDAVRINGNALNTTNTTFAYAYDANSNGVTTDSGENNYIVLTINSVANILDGTSLKNGSYTLKLPAGAISDGTTANSSEVSYNFTVTGNTSSGTAIVTLASVVQDAANPSKLTFTFGGTANGLPAAALDASKYMINGTALPTGTTLYFLGTNKVVVAEIPSGTIPVNGTRNVKVANITDKDGNTLSSTNNVDVALVENVKPTVVSGTLVSDKAVSVTLSENIVDPGTEGGVEVWINGTKVDYASNAATYGYSNNVLTITLTNANTFAAGQTIIVKFNGTNIDDAANNTVLNGQATVQ